MPEGALAITPGFEPDYSGYYGPVIGGGLSIGKPGGEPYRYRMKLSGGFAPFSDFRGQLKFSGDFRTIVPQAALIVDAATSGLDRLRYYGEGNEHYFRGSGFSDDDFEIAQQVTTLGVSLRFPVQKNCSWSAGIGAKWVDLDIAQGSYADLHRSEIRGIDDNFSGSFRFGFHYDATDKSCSGIDTARRAERRSSAAMESNAAVFGTLIDAGVSFHPVFFGNERTFTKLYGEVRRYIPVSSDRCSRVALRVGGEKIWGEFPFWDAAYLGGTTSLRGYDKQRFAGNASLYAGSEVRLHAGQFSCFVPVAWGPLAFVETGRVFLDGEDSSAWHTGAGCGLWFGIDDSRYFATVAYGRGFDDGRLMEETGFYARAGFSF